MRPTDLKSPGFIANSVLLTNNVYRAISYAEIMAHRSPDSDTAKVLTEFFEDCTAKCKAIVAAQAKVKAAATKKEKTA